jgi:ketosteroid isomerase-like protein
MDPIERLAHDFITATGDGDLETVAAMYAPGAVIWINATGTEMPAADGIGVLAALHRRAAAVRYEVLEVIPTAQGYVQRHILHVTVPAREDRPAQDLAVPACLVVRVRDGLITRLDEYLDSGQIAPLFAR